MPFPRLARCLVPALVCFCAGVGSLAAQDYWVDADLGSDVTGDGSSGNPWRTVNFALTGGGAGSGSTIHIVGTSGNAYCTSSGEIFPWATAGNISFVGEPGGGGNDPLIDGEGLGQDIIVYDSGTPVSSSTISDLIIRNADVAILADQVGGEFSPVIEDCVFEENQRDVEIRAAAGSTVAATLRNNQFSKTLPGGLEALWVDLGGADADVEVSGNQVDVDTTLGVGAYLTGSPSSGEVRISSNTVVANSSAVILENFHGRVRCESNTLDGFNCGWALQVLASGPWDPDSVIEGNTCFGEVEFAFTDGISFTSNSVELGMQGVALVMCGGARILGNTIRDNTAASTDPDVAGIRVSGGAGGHVIRNNLVCGNPDGIRVDAPHCRLEENHVEGNLEWGVVLETGGFDTTLQESRITANALGGLRLGAADATVAANLIDANLGPGILGAVVDDGVIASNLVHGNLGAGLEISAPAAVPAPRVVGNTFATNGGPGVESVLPPVGTFWISNCVLWDNNGAADDLMGVAPGDYSFNDIESGGVLADGNIALDPLFVDPNGGDYHLDALSPCIDAGDLSENEWATDYEGDPRTLDTLGGGPETDMGADEVSATDLRMLGAPSAGATVTLEVDGPAGEPYDVYVATDPTEPPLAPPPGIEVAFYGTVILDTTKLYSTSPVFSGTIPGSGTASFPATIPGGSFIGMKVVLQATVGSPGGFAQLTPAVAFTITP